MKNYFLFIFWFFLISCNQEEKSYRISGSINGDYEGLVYLYFAGGKKDSAYVRKNNFVFSGKVDHPAEATFHTAGTSTSNRNFYVENREMNVVLDVSTKTFKDIQLSVINIDTLVGSPTFYVWDFFEGLKEKYRKEPLGKQVILSKADSLVRHYSQHPFSGSLLHNLSNDTLIDKEDLKVLYKVLDLKSMEEHNLLRLHHNLFPEKKVKKGDPFPDFFLPNTNEKVVSSEEFRQDHYVLVDFWASWCIPCRKQFPQLKKLAANDKFNKNFKILGVSLDKEPKQWLKVHEADSLSWENVIDTTAFKGKLAKTFGIKAIPYNFLVDPAGEIIAVDVEPGELEILLDSLSVESNKRKPLLLN